MVERLCCEVSISQHSFTQVLSNSFTFVLKVVAAEKESKGGLQEKLTMTVAVPYLWGVPPTAERLHRADQIGEGIVDKVYRQWDFLAKFKNKFNIYFLLRTLIKNYHWITIIKCLLINVLILTLIVKNSLRIHLGIIAINMLLHPLETWIMNIKPNPNKT